MIDPADVPAVGGDEILARYVLQSNHLRRSDRTLKPDAFLPHERFGRFARRVGAGEEVEHFSYPRVDGEPVEVSLLAGATAF